MKANSPATYDFAIVMAMRALAVGKANDGQQKLALDWIITRASNVYDMSYRLPEDGGDSATNFHEGRRFTGNQILKLLNSEEVLKAVMREQEANEAKK